VKVRGVQVHGQARNEAMAGQRAAVNLAGVEVGEITRGETLTRPDAVTVTRRADVRIDLLPQARPLRHGARIRFHQGTRELQARVAAASGGEIAPGAAAFARVHLDSPAALVRGDRFVLRTYSPPATIGGGTVLDPSPPRRGVRTAAAAARFERLAGSDADAVLTMTEESALQGFPLAQVHGRAGLALDRGDAVVDALVRSGSAVVRGGVLFSLARLDAIRERVLALVKAHHARHPLEEGIPREELRERLFSGAAPTAFDLVIGNLGQAGTIVARERVALRGHSLALTDEEARARDAMTALFETEALAPPDGVDLVARIGTRKEVIDRVAGLLVRQKILVRVGDLLFHESALRRLKDEVRALKVQAGTESIDVATFKERYHVSRKYAIPLLEFLDRERVTRRVGDARQIL
jgi:selenocysteine-specific elongation factor